MFMAIVLLKPEGIAGMWQSRRARVAPPPVATQAGD
jgi:hypothetical protein